MPVAPNPADVQPFDSIALDRLRRRKSEKWSKYARDVLPAFVAEMDFDLAPPLRDALIAAVELGDVGYASSAQLPAAFVSFARDRFAWKVDERDVFSVPDVMAGVAEALAVLTPPGAPVVINPPVYPPFFDVIRHEDRTLVEVPLVQDETSRWVLDFEALERAFANGAQAYLLCSPHNPVGRVWSEPELQKIASLSERYGVAVISDEIHAPLVMPGFTFVPYLQVVSDGPCIALSSASKAFNIPGLKCAVMVAGPLVREALRQSVKSRPDEVEARTGQLGVIATLAAFRNGTAWLDDLLAYLDENRRGLAALLGERIPQARYEPPEATYLAWVDCRDLNLGADPASVFLERGRVALESGRRFGGHCAGWVRLNFGTSREIVTEIVSRMTAALA